MICAGTATGDISVCHIAIEELDKPELTEYSLAGILKNKQKIDY